MRIILRAIGLTLWTIALVASCALLFVHWQQRIIDAREHGYSNWFERYQAEAAGFFDPELYRQALLEKAREERAQRMPRNMPAWQHR